MKKIFFLMLSASLLLLAACSKDEDDDVLSKTSAIDVNDGAYGFVSKAFSVSETTKVFFSKGNLQYNASADTWRFAEYQWEKVGKDNANIGKDGYTGWIDFFGWGTGNAPIKCVETNSNYSTFDDWGSNAKLIETLGEGWRTLSKDEWNYFIINGKWGFATVNSVAGLVLLPDEWNMPDGCSLTLRYSGTAKTNNFSVEQWGKMETAGAVFLPLAGYRAGVSCSSVGSKGNYWLSTSNGADNAYAVVINSSSVSMDYKNRYFGQSVRLVRENAFARIDLE